MFESKDITRLAIWTMLIPLSKELPAGASVRGNLTNAKILKAIVVETETVPVPRHIQYVQLRKNKNPTDPLSMPKRRSGLP